MSAQYTQLVAQIAQITHRDDLTSQMPNFVGAANELINVRLSLSNEVPTAANTANEILAGYPNLYLYASLISAYEFTNEIDMAQHYIARYENEIERYFITAAGGISPTLVMGADPFYGTSSTSTPGITLPIASTNVSTSLTGSGFSRNLQQNLDERATVTDFGALGDGSTNNNGALSAAVAYNSTIYVPKGTGNYLTTRNNVDLVGKWVGEGQIQKDGGTTHSPNFIIANTEPSPRTTASQAATAQTAFTGDLSKSFQPVEVRVLGADTLGNPNNNAIFQTGFHFCQELFPYYTHIVNDAGFNYAHNGAEGRSSMSAIRIVGTHRGGGGILPISTATWADGNRGASEAASYGDGLATTTFLANPAAAGGNFSTSAGADAVYLNPLEVNCLDNPSGASAKNCAAIGFVANMVRDGDNTASPLDCMWQGVRVQSKGAYPIDTVLTASGVGGATTFIDATPTTLDAGGELLLMKDGQRIYGNATFDANVSRWKRATHGDDWIGYASSVNGWTIFTDGVERLRLSTSVVSVPNGSFNITSGNLNITNNLGLIAIGGTQVLEARRGGWTQLTGSKARDTFDTDTATVLQVASRLGALIDDLYIHGMIGA